MTFIEQIIDKAKSKTDAAEVFHLKSETTACAWNADLLKMAEAKETMGIALRVLINGHIGFFATNKLVDPEKIVDTACELAPYGFEFKGEFPKAYKLANAFFFHAPTAEIGLNTIIEAGNSVIKEVKCAKSDAIFEAKLDREIMEVEIANSFGAHAHYRKTGFSGFVYGTVTKEGDVLSLYDFDSSIEFSNQHENWAKNIADGFRNAEKIVPLASGEYQCIVTPKASGFMGPLYMAMNARSIIKDMSPFKGKLGEKIFDSRVTLIDDGLHPTMPGNQPIDDEGVTSQRTTLVEAGVLKAFVQDLHTSKIMGVTPTGNGRRGSMSAAPRAGYSTLSLTPGKRTLNEMIKGMKKGVVIDQIMGAHQASPFSGDFSVSVDLGYVVEDGHIVGRFKDGMLSGNVFKMLNEQIAEIGSEPRFTSALVPPVMYDRMSIST
jgi:PmbA protein